MDTFTMYGFRLYYDYEFLTETDFDNGDGFETEDEAAEWAEETINDRINGWILDEAWTPSDNRNLFHYEITEHKFYDDGAFTWAA